MTQVRAFGIFDSVAADFRPVKNAHGMHEPMWTTDVLENGVLDPRTTVAKDASRTDAVLRKLEGLLMRQVLDAMLPKGGMFGVKGGLTGDVYRSIVVDHIAEKLPIAVLLVGKSG